ncbi:MAG: hypothetical protein HOP08_08205 [Cyclobacteriaceae bacterium]|nr:hypothetical protein [Cyclobacteriaceae bacterium]
MKLLLTLVLLVFYTGNIQSTNLNDSPRPVTRTSIMDKNGNGVIRTQILFNRTTSREEVISTCTFLAKENTQLTFDRLEIGKSVFGVFGRNRLKYLSGSIELPDGSIQKFKAGGVFAFHSVKIIYSNQMDSKSFLIEMIEIID